MDVVRQSFQRRDINNLNLVSQVSIAGHPYQTVETNQECGEGFSGAGRSGNENIMPGGDFTPPGNLRFCRLTKTTGEPFGDEGIKVRKRHRPGLF